ncbi:S-layer homology domain-containing protein [Paenibacillaceae bacterium WGS1546]|uniref:S-layer homology domain-containing protein n=1 Tax=Cohnella sp. WGS1546 TaxID=3366810 RepID=UPI00372D53EF
MQARIRKPFLMMLLLAVVSLSLTGAVYANQVKEKTNGNKPITAAQAVTSIVKGLDLNLDHIRFVKEPKASDYFTKVKDDAPYANDFIVAMHNGVELPKDVSPTANVTREQFSAWLFGALSSKGDYAWIEIFLLIADEDQISDGYMNAIQKLLIAKIATLDGKQRFHPKKPVTQTEAAVMIKRTADFVKEMSSVKEPESPILNDVKLSTEKETDDVVKVTVTATAPHPGYGLEITGIQFSEGKAMIQYRELLPDPDGMYPQVITDVSATTYIPIGYEAVLGDGTSASASASSPVFDNPGAPAN